MLVCNCVSALSLAVSLLSTSNWIAARAVASAVAWVASAVALASMLVCNCVSALSLAISFWSTSAWTSSMFSWSESAAVVNCPNDARCVAAVASEAVTFPDTVTSPVTLALAPSVVSPATFRVEFKVVAPVTATVEPAVTAPCKSDVS